MRLLPDDRAVAGIVAGVGMVDDPFLRGLLSSAVWETVRRVRFAPVRYIARLLGHLPGESDEQIALATLSCGAAELDAYLPDEASAPPRLQNYRRVRSNRIPTPPHCLYRPASAVVDPICRPAYRSAMTRNQPWRKVLIALFVAIVAFTGYHAVRTVSDVIYWNAHRDEPIESWMSIGYVAHSYHVPPHILHEALSLPPMPDRRPLARIARDRGLSMAQIEAKLTFAIVHARPPYPPPGPPAPPAPEPRAPSSAK